MTHHYQDSMCQEDKGLLHHWQFLYSHKGGIVEKCKYCCEKQFIPADIPNDIYLSTHLREALQPSDPLFNINYPNFLMI